ncbi:MAG TPA: M28 family peptidase, partial [Thermoanaerobaculia bacterium]|nr:M28 family peptidase [Thermoanaerobaculia bacterium]
SKQPGFAWVDGAGRPRDLPPELRGAAFLSASGAEALFAGAPHRLDEIFRQATAGKVPRFALPVEAALRGVSRRERTASPNVAALLPGSDPRLRDEVVVLSAHLDHLGVGEPVAGDAIYNGAFDNASGIAILLEVAGALARLPERPRRSVLFLAVTAEESGLHGSDYFARHPTVPAGRIVANVNLDMALMLFPLRDVIAFGAEHSSLGPTVEEAARRLGLAVTPDPAPEQVIFIRSDHYSFVKQGIPSIFLATGLQSGDPAIKGPARWGEWLATTYHKPGDDMAQKIDFESGAQFARLNFLVAHQIAQADRAPSWNPGDFFGEKFRGIAAKQ